MSTPSRAMLALTFAMTDEADTITALRAGDVAAFDRLVVRHHAMLVRIALTWVKEVDVAEEVAQQTWLVMLESLTRFEGRSSLRTWLCGIALNIARVRARAERRLVPMPSLLIEKLADSASRTEVDRVQPDAGRWVAQWRDAPVLEPDAALERAELHGVLERALRTLPAAQQRVVILSDLEGLTGLEVSNILGISHTHQRVLLHRAHAKLRQRLGKYLTRRAR